MNITITGFAIIASLSNAVTLPITGTNILPAQTQVLSKDELVQIISSNQQANINLGDLKLTVPSLTIDNTVFMAKTLILPNKNSLLISTEKALGDDE